MCKRKFLNTEYCQQASLEHIKVRSVIVLALVMNTDLNKINSLPLGSNALSSTVQEKYNVTTQMWTAYVI